VSGARLLLLATSRRQDSNQRTHQCRQDAHPIGNIHPTELNFIKHSPSFFYKA